MQELIKKIILIPLLFLTIISNAQIVSEKWESCFGGTESDEGTGIIEVSGIYYTIGYTASNDGDISYNHGSHDFWFVTVDSAGNLLNEKTFGGSIGDGGFVDIQKLNDSVFYLAGVTKSTDGDISDNPWPGLSNIWILKITKQGEILWESVHGGSKIDWMRDMEVTDDGGIIALSLSNSDDGDVSNPNGSDDLWLIKLNSNGEKQWDFSLGGEGSEGGGSVIETSDKGFLISGHTNGEGGGNYDTTCNFHGIPGGGFVDIWLVKLDSSRNIEWQQCYGGTYHDFGSNVRETEEGYIILGHTMSNDGDVSGLNGPPGPNSEYGGDIWVFKIDKQGNLLWQNCLGGLYNDFARNIFPTTDSGYMIVGRTQSDDGDVEGFNGYQAGGYDDVWFAKIDSLGNLTWQYCYGGLGTEYIYRGVYQKSDYNYVLTIGTETDEWQCSEEDVAPPDVRIVELYDTTVGVDEKVSNTSDVEIYPNPTNSILNIVLPQNFNFSNATMEIFNIDGKTIFNRKLTSLFLQIDVEKINSGLYFVKIQNNEKLITKKVIIQ
jgi:hypothetical protein